MESTWASRDLPVLSAIVRLSENGVDPVLPKELVDATGFDTETVQRALIALTDEDPAFFDVVDTNDFVGREILAVNHPTGHARRAVGAWPDADHLAERIVAALEDPTSAAESHVDPGRWRRVRDGVLSGGKDLAVEVLAAAIVRGSGLG